MTCLKVYSDTAPQKPEVETCDPAEISKILRNLGVRFEQWQASIALANDAGQDEVIAAYQSISSGAI